MLLTTVEFHPDLFLTTVEFHQDQEDSSSGWFEGREKKLRRYNDIDYRLIIILCCFLSFSFMIRLY